MNIRVLLRSSAAIVAALFSLASAWAQGCGTCGMSSCGAGGCVCGCGNGGGLNNSDPAGPGATFQSSPNVILRSRLSLDQIGGAGKVGSAIWGWRDPNSYREFALYGLSNGTAFIEVTNPDNPTYLGMLPTATGESVWRELQTYKNYAYIVSDGNGAHGMQIFDLNRLLTANQTSPTTFSADARYTGVTNVHTISINTSTGMALLNGSNQTQHILSLTNPLSPTALGNYSGQGYVHDALPVTYHGPDSRYAGKQIVFNSGGGNGLNVVDFTNPAAPVRVNGAGTNTYPGLGYTHQGWLTEDQRFLIVNDEFDEANNQSNPNMRTKTHIWDMADLQNPRYIGFYLHDGRAIDHNLFIKGNLVYMSNYTSGLRIFDIAGLYDLPTSGAVSQSQIQSAFRFAGFFDTYNQDDANPQVSFNGQWGNYPYLPSGTILAGDRNNGLFVLSLNAPEPGTFGLLAIAGLSGLVVLRRRRR
jgi:choice-of-anchor B domain-containing protein